MLGRARRTKQRISRIPLALGYALGKLKPLHPYLPDRLLYQLPLSWNLEMMRSFLLWRRKRVYIDVHCRLDPPRDMRPRVETEPEYRLAEADVRRFYEDGFLGPFTLLPREQMLARSDRMWELFEQPSQTYPPGTYSYVGDRNPNQRDDEMSNEEYVRRFLNARDKHLDDDQLLDLFAHPAITERVAQLLGPDLLLWRTQFFPKFPGMGGTGWHQASSYLNETMRVSTLAPPKLDELFQLTVWLAVEDSTLDNGCLRFLRGSHREIQPMTIEEYDPRSDADNKVERFGALIMRPHQAIDPAKIVDVEMKAGQFVIFSERTMHGSNPNVTADNRRLAVNARYITPATRIHNPWVLGEGGLDITYGRVRGLRLDRWKALLVRGDDRHGVNAGRVARLR